VTGVRTFRQYLSDKGTAYYSDHLFCGSCARLIRTPHDFERTPADLDDRGSFPLGSCHTHLHYAFCPWCGVEFEDDWWRETIVENERAIDHYDQPGTHKGDTHEFRGSGPDCIAGHVLASSDHSLCWCKPTVEPGILGCRIIHNDVERTPPALPSWDDDGWADE